MLAVAPSNGSDLTAQRLLRLTELYQTGQASPLVTATINKLFAHEVAEARTQLQQLQTDLAEFEARYQLNSQDFYTQYQAGQTDDRMDFVEWASLVQMVANLHQRLQLLSGESVV